MSKKLESLKTCPVCGSDCTEDYLNTELTTFFFPLPKELCLKATKKPIRLLICKKCSFIFQTDVKKELLDLIYNVFYKHYNLDTSIEFQEVYRERTITFMKNMLPDNEHFKVLDVGCGEGTYFPFFESMGYISYGIEPSEKANIAKEKNPNATISQDYFENHESNVFNTRFNVILLNWVLEHITDLDSFFRKLAEYMTKRAKIIIQVPDIQYYFSHFLPLFYVHEHINYFTIETLSLLFEKHGFNIIGKKYGDSPSILICAEYTGIKSIKEVNHSILYQQCIDFLVKNEKLKNSIEKIIVEYDRIILYGIGLLAFWIGDACLKNIDKRRIELIDDNSFYCNKFVPFFNKELSTHSFGYNLDNTLVMICASPVYHRKIKKVLNEKYTGSYKIAFIEGNRFVIESSEK